MAIQPMQLLKFSISRFIARSCFLCNTLHYDSSSLCDLCYQHLQPIDYSCNVCALPLVGQQFLTCGHCIKNKPHFDKIYSAYRFEPLLRTLLHQFKYYEQLFLSDILTQLMLEAHPKILPYPQCLIPVPLHPQRFKQRGFNQAHELARKLAYSLKWPLRSNLCQRVKATKAQAHLSHAHRKTNVKEAFIAYASPYRHIMLIDDVITSGNTINALALAFKKAGVERVDAWSCARASEYYQ